MPEQRWYLSFVKDRQFMGGCVVAGETIVDALARATSLGINPGGQVRGVRIPETCEVTDPMDTFLTKEKLEADGGHRHGDLPKELQDTIDALSEAVCEGDNTGPTRH